MRKVIFLILIFCLLFFVAGCSLICKESIFEGKLGKSVAFSNGVTFEVTEAKFQTTLISNYNTYTADTGNKYLVATVCVTNNSSEGFTAYGDDIWLDYKGARIAQVNLVKNFGNGYHDISQSPTTSVSYYAFFQVGENVKLSDLCLVIDNGSWLKNEKVKIRLLK